MLQSRTAATLQNATGVASANVITARVLAFSNPTTVLSPWHQSELRRMVAEKTQAAGDGMLASGTELAMLPLKMMSLVMRPSSWSPGGWMSACQDAAELWISVGNAALRPAKQAVTRNQSRLARTRV